MSGLSPDELIAAAEQDGIRVDFVDTRIGRVYLRSLMGDEYMFYCQNTGPGGINLLLLSYSDDKGNAHCSTRNGKGNVWIKQELADKFIDKLPGDVMDQLIKAALGHCFPHTMTEKAAEKNLESGPS